MGAQGINTGLHLVDSNSEEGSNLTDDTVDTLLEDWRHDVRGLMDWLNWSMWMACDPACNAEVCQSLIDYCIDTYTVFAQEMCYMPTWSYFEGKPPNWPPKPYCFPKWRAFQESGTLELSALKPT